MTTQIATINANQMALPSHLQGYKSKLAGASADIKSMEAYPVIKMDRGLWLVRNGDKVERMTAVVQGADGVPERVPDVVDMVILAFTDVIYSYFTPGQEMGGSKPLCFSVGGVVPHSAATNKQSNICKHCPQNKDGSGQNNKGKACGKRRMALGFRLNDPNREIVALQIPTLSNWFDPDNAPGWFGFQKYVTQLNQHELPIELVVTRALADGAGEKPRINFCFAGYIDGPTLEHVRTDAIRKSVDEMRDFFEYKNEPVQVPSVQAPPPATATGSVVADSLYAMLANPATAAAAIAGLQALGLPLTPPAADPLVALRVEFPGLPDVALQAIHAARNPGAAPVVTDPLAALRSEFPGVPDVALQQIKAAREAAVPQPSAAVTPATAVSVPPPATAAVPPPAAEVVPPPAVEVVHVVEPTPSPAAMAAALTPPAVLALPEAPAAVDTTPTPAVVDGSPDSEAALDAMKNFIANL